MSEQERLEVEQLRQRLEEAEETLRAIRSGEVDAVVVSDPKGDKVYVLKGAEQPYRLFVETMSEGAVTLLADGTIAYANQRFAEMLKTPLEQIIGAPLEAFVAPDHRHVLRSLLIQALTADTKAEIRLLTARGTALWAELLMRPAKPEAGSEICLIANDISERKKADDLRAYIASIVDSSEDAIIGKDLDGIILSWNRGAERLYGYSAAEIVGRPVSLLVAPDRGEEVEGLLARIGRGESVERYETERIRKDGQRIQISLTVSPIRNRDGRIEGASSIAHDITAHKRAEEALQAERQRLFAVLETMPAMICLLTPDHHMAFTNRGFREKFGQSHGRRCYEYCFGRSSPCEFCQSFQVLQTGQPHQWEVTMPDGSVIEAHDYPFTDADGSPMVLEMDFDITERKRAAEELRQLNQDLEQRVRERTAELQAVLDSAPTPIWISHDPQCRRITGNAYADEVIMQVPRGGNISAGALPEQAAVTYKLLRNGRELRPEEMPAQVAAATGQPVLAEGDLELVFPDGRNFSLLLSAAPLFNGEGKVRGAVAAGADVTSLRQAERALRENEERLRLALLASDAGVWDWNMETDAVWYSPRWKSMLGYAEEELEPDAAAWKRLLHDDDRQRALEVVQAVMRGEREYNMEFRLLHKDGHYVPILSRGLPMRREPEGPVVRIVGTHVDLTERKAAEESLRNAEALRRVGAYTRSLIEASLDPLVAIDRDGNITDVNQSTELATGLSREALIGADFSNYFTDAPKAWEGYRQVFREGRVRDYELEIQHRDGHVTPVLYNASLYRDEAGEVAGVFAAARDISQRKRAEHAVLAERQRFFDVLETLPAMICLLTKDYHVAFANRSFRECFGDSGGRPCYEYCYGKSTPCEFCESFESFKTGRPHPTRTARP